MVPATQHVINVLKGTTHTLLSYSLINSSLFHLKGDDGVFKHAKKGTILLDCSTIDPVASKNLSTEAKALGFDMIDAPVSGGVTGAAAGTALLTHLLTYLFNYLLFHVLTYSLRNINIYGWWRGKYIEAGRTNT